jgi:glycosyltransferase involved in cell wall biosynthesis
MTVTEAAACGTPAVVSRVPGHEDAVVDGVTGLLASGRDELRLAMHTVLRDPDVRARMSTAARDHAARFTWESTARRTLEVLAGAARAHRIRRGLVPPSGADQGNSTTRGTSTGTGTT